MLFLALSDKFCESIARETCLTAQSKLESRNAKSEMFYSIQSFVSACLARPQSSRKSTIEQPQPPRNESSSSNTFLCLPREILDLTISHLSLRDALSLCSSSRELLHLTDSTFWRFWTLQSHGRWFWELQNYPKFSSKENWMLMLQILTASRFDILKGAEPYWLDTSGSKNDGTKNRSTNRAEDPLLPLPLGLRNR